MRGSSWCFAPNTWTSCSHPGGWGWAVELDGMELWGPGCSIQPSHPPTKKKKKGKKENPWGTVTPPRNSEKLLATLLIDGDLDLFLLIVTKVTCVPRAFKLWYGASTWRGVKNHSDLSSQHNHHYNNKCEWANIHKITYSDPGLRLH